MKIAIIGSAPSSIRLAPYGDPQTKIWACSPGTYSVIPRCDKFFELHRWEPGVIGRAETQVPWFTPEYVAWMRMQKCVVMTEPVPDIPNSVRLEKEYLEDKYGTYFFTSSIAWMLAMAIEDILESRRTRTDHEEDLISLFGVDMAHTTEYGMQRPGCQFFCQIANQVGIDIYVPPESDLMRPAPPYGVIEHSHHWIKMTARKRDLENRLAVAKNNLINVNHEISFLTGALDELNYEMNTWHDNPVGQSFQWAKIVNNEK